MKTQLKIFLAINQYGDKEMFTGYTPRKALFDKLGVTFGRKIYRDMTINGEQKTFHIGYSVAGNWWTLYEVTPLRKEVA